MSDRRPPGDGDEERSGALDETLASANLPNALVCPFCESTDTRQFALFGGQASTSQYYCNACRTVFEALRWR
ncbi:MAG: hypothetical protein R3266_07795 [Gemmatimonadota bacterium]|nr:hypothetical protein [Gemmatimonadota bacterium]